MIKRFTEIVLPLALMVFAGTAQAVVTDLAVNGGFETGDTSNWTTFLNPPNQTLTVDNTSPFAGSFNGVLNNTDPGTAAVIKQANLGVGLLTPGDAVTVSFYARGSAANGGVHFAELFSEVAPSGTSKSEILGGGPLFPASSTTWQFYTFTTTLGPDVSNGLTLQFNAATGAIAGSTSLLEIDNVSIQANVIPVPAAVWLFGSGLVGLVGVARRKKKAA